MEVTKSLFFAEEVVMTFHPLFFASMIVYMPVADDPPSTASLFPCDCST